jgi:heterodisulfide reductase subunit B
MTILWHCRSCNECGNKSMNLQDLIKYRKDQEDMIHLLIRLLEHKCEDPQIGIKIDGDSQ